MGATFATEGLTEQEVDIAAELTANAFDNHRRSRKDPRWPKYRQMSSNEFFSAMCEAMHQQKFAHLRKKGKGIDAKKIFWFPNLMSGR